MRRLSNAFCRTAGAVIALAFGIATAQAADSTFFEGKTIRIVVPAGAGGSYGLYTQTVAPFLKRHIPGHPEVVPQYMPGGGGITAANYFASAAAHDGTVLAMPHDSLAIYQMLNPDKVKYDAREFRWLGTIGGAASTVTMWHGSKVKTVDDAKKTEAVLGATGKGSFQYTIPALMNAILGTKFRIITGYPGTAELDLAMERGEIDGHGANWLAWKTNKADWLREGKVVHLVQIAHRPAADLKNVPLVADLAPTQEGKQMFRFASSMGLIGRGLALPPGVPADRVAMLRKAMDETMKDPAFLKEGEARKIDVDPIPGEEVNAALEQIFATPPAVVAKVRSLLESK